jgi:hypothetical protein
MPQTGAASLGPADRDQPVLEAAMFQIRRDTRIAPQQRLDLGNRDAVPLAMCAIAFVPIKSRNQPFVHLFKNIRMYVQLQAAL